MGPGEGQAHGVHMQVTVPRIMHAGGPRHAAAVAACGEMLRRRVLHCDEDLLVLDKPAGLAVQGGPGRSLCWGTQHWLSPQACHRGISLDWRICVPSAVMATCWCPTSRRGWRCRAVRVCMCMRLALCRKKHRTRHMCGC